MWIKISKEHPPSGMLWMHYGKGLVARGIVDNEGYWRDNVRSMPIHWWREEQPAWSEIDQTSQLIEEREAMAVVLRGIDTLATDMDVALSHVRHLIWEEHHEP